MLWFLIGCILGLVVGFSFGLFSGISYTKQKFQEELDMLDDLSRGDLSLLLRSIMQEVQDIENGEDCCGGCCDCHHDEDEHEKCCGGCCENCHCHNDEEEGE